MLTRENVIERIRQLPEQFSWEDLIQALGPVNEHEVARIFIQEIFPSRKPSFQELSAREKEILNLLVKGASGEESARELNIKHVTVDIHLRSIRQKLGVNLLSEVLKDFVLAENENADFYKTEVNWNTVAEQSSILAKNENSAALETEAEWNAVTIEEFFKGYAEADAIYDDL